MGRSNHGDASDDPFDGDADDDALGAAAEGYPRAPLPAHERAWRHPSEVGQAAWVSAEPAVALGRGVLVASGAIGVALGFAILWMMLPIGGGTAPLAEPTVARSVDGVAAARATTTLRGSSTSSSLPAPTTAPAFAGAPATVTLPAEDVPSGTVMLQTDERDEQPAIAVRIGDSPMMLTTEHAVGGQIELSIVSDGGATSMATVVNVEGSLAWLAPESSDTGEVVAVGFATSAKATPGEVLHALAPEPVSFTFDGSTMDLDVVEGTPVVNDDGALVALCSRRGDTVVLVPVPAPDDPPTTTPPDDGSITTGGTAPRSEGTGATTIPPPATTVATGTTTPAVTGSAWLGVRLGPPVDGHAGVPIVGVTPGSPAEGAGFTAGQRILTIDGVPVHDRDDVTAILRAHRPGDVIVVSVLQPGPPTPAATPSTVLASSSSVAPAAPTTTSSAPTTTRAASSSTTVAASTTPATVAPSTVAVPTEPATTMGSTVAVPTTTPTNGTIVRISVLLGVREPSV